MIIIYVLAFWLIAGIVYGVWRNPKTTKGPFLSHNSKFDPGIILNRPQPWWDQRNVHDATPAEQPASIDYTDLSMLGWKP